MHYIEIENVLAENFLKQGIRRLICRTDKITFHCAIQTQKNGPRYIVIGAKLLKTLGLRLGQKLKAQLSADTSEYKFEMPQELKEVLATDPTADKLFHSLTEGNQRSLMALVLQVKSSQKRIERALKISENLKRGHTTVKNALR